MQKYRTQASVAIRGFLKTREKFQNVQKQGAGRTYNCTVSDGEVKKNHFADAVYM